MSDELEELIAPTPAPAPATESMLGKDGWVAAEGELWVCPDCKSTANLERPFQWVPGHTKERRCNGCQRWLGSL